MLRVAHRLVAVLWITALCFSLFMFGFPFPFVWVRSFVCLATALAQAQSAVVDVYDVHLYPRCNLYMFLTAATYIPIISIDTFYVADGNCIPGGIPSCPTATADVHCLPELVQKHCILACLMLAGKSAVAIAQALHPPRARFPSLVIPFPAPLPRPTCGPTANPSLRAPPFLRPCHFPPSHL